MIVVQRELWLCVDCTIVACNGDYSGIDSQKTIDRVNAGLERLGPHLVPDFDSESEEGIRYFSSCGCDCCGSRLAGTMHRFAILGES